MDGNSLAVQWLGLCTSTAGGMGPIPSQGTKIPHEMQCGQKKKNGLKAISCGIPSVSGELSLFF